MRPTDPIAVGSVILISVDHHLPPIGLRCRNRDSLRQHRCRPTPPEKQTSPLLAAPLSASAETPRCAKRRLSAEKTKDHGSAPPQSGSSACGRMLTAGASVMPVSAREHSPYASVSPAIPSVFEMSIWENRRGLWSFEPSKRHLEVESSRDARIRGPAPGARTRTRSASVAPARFNADARGDRFRPKGHDSRFRYVHSSASARSGPAGK